MNNISTFNNPAFGSVRAVSVNDEPYFVGRDVAEILGYSNPRKAIGDHVDDEDKTDGVTIRDSIGREQAPKVLFANAVETAHNSILIGDLAKIIRQNGVDIGQKRLFDWMRQNGYLIKGGQSKNMPTQKAMDMNLFEVKESTVNNPDGSVRITRTTKVTGKGQTYFVKKFLA